MTSLLQQFIRKRAREKGLSITTLCRKAGLSRPTLYESWSVGGRLPNLGTIIALAGVLEVHPMRLLQMLFADMPLAPAVQRAASGDRSAFLADVTYPDGAQVLCGDTFTKTWRLENAGSVPWHGRTLRCQDDDVVVLRRDGQPLEVGSGLVPASACVAVADTLPGQAVEVSVTFTAPPQPCTALSYWKMVSDNDAVCFPEAVGLWVKVQVIAPVLCAGGGLDDALRWLRQ